MIGEIQLTFNDGTINRTNDIELLSDAIRARGLTPTVVRAYQMHMHMHNDIPYALINLSAFPNETHLRYVRHMELSGSKVINHILPTMYSTDKFLSNLELKHININVPKTLNLLTAYRNVGTTAYIKDQIGFPCVLKYPTSAFGVGVHLIKDEKEFEDIYDILTVSATRYGDFSTTSNFMVQEFIPETLGKDIRVLVLNGKCIGAMLRVNPIGWSVKRVQWSPDRPETHADIIYSEYNIDSELSDTCIRICDKLNLSFAGLDVLFGKDSYIYGEVNPFPGLSNFNKMNPKADLPGQLVDILINRE